MPSCAIKWCGKNTSTSSHAKDGISFHIFPNDPAIKEKWISASRRENFYPTKHSVVCSRHFTADCFEFLKNNKRRLFHSSVPTLNLPILVNLNPGEDSSSYFEPSKKKRKFDDDSECDDNDSDFENEYDQWAKECALDLRQMSLEQQELAKTAIAYILMQGRLGHLPKNSIQINTKFPSKHTAQENLNNLQLDGFLAKRKGKSVAACSDVAAPSGSSLILVGPGRSSVTASHKTTTCLSRGKSKPLNKSEVSNAVTASHKSTTLVNSSSLDNTAPLLNLETYKTALPVSTSSSRVKTKSSHDLESNSVVAFQQITAPVGSSSILVKYLLCKPIDETESSSQEIAAPVASSPFLVKVEPCDHNKSNPLSAFHDSEFSVKKSPPRIKSETKSPPSSPGFTVTIKEEPE